MLQYTYGKNREYYEQIEKEFQSSPVFNKSKGPYTEEESDMIDNYVCAVIRLAEMDQETSEDKLREIEE